jgi:DNA-binding NarL/FixJ family response regulator
MQYMATSVSYSINILLICSQPLFRAGLRSLIEKNEGMKVVGEAKTLAEALETVKVEKPNIILLDFDVGNREAFDFVASVRKAATEARVILLTGTFDPKVYSSAMCVGVKGFVTKEQDEEKVIKAIRKVHSGEVWIDRAFMADVVDHIPEVVKVSRPDPEAANIRLLTERELEVIHLVSKGLKNKAIAERLLISEATVRHHLTSIFSKLNVSDRFDLVLYAFRHGIVDLPR